MDPIVSLIIRIAGGALVGIIVGFLIRKSIAEKKIGSAEAQANNILNNAIKDAENAKKEAIISAKEEIFQIVNQDTVNIMSTAEKPLYESCIPAKTIFRISI
jgi:uncharacterized membrane protein YraQ (UPF0718 family)